jgi:MFS family permease
MTPPSDEVEVATQAYIAKVAPIGDSASEACDFLAYRTVVALVFGKLVLATMTRPIGTIAAFGAFASGLLVRPVGSFIFGHFGDRLGSKGDADADSHPHEYRHHSNRAAAGLCVTRYLGAGITRRITPGPLFGGAMLRRVEHSPLGFKSLFGNLAQGGGNLAEVALYCTVLLFSVCYAISTLGFDRALTLRAVGAVNQIVTSPLFGKLGDGFGSRRVCAFGAFVLGLMTVAVDEVRTKLKWAGAVEARTMRSRIDQREGRTSAAHALVLAPVNIAMSDCGRSTPPGRSMSADDGSAMAPNHRSSWRAPDRAKIVREITPTGVELDSASRSFGRRL